MRCRFSEANKLRFLHAKKFDIDDTRKTIVEHCKWRSLTIPIAVTPELQAFLVCPTINIELWSSVFQRP